MEFSRLAQTMQSRHEREECSPFLLFSQKSKTESIPSRSSAIKLASQLPARPSSVITQTISHVLAPEAETKEVAPAIASDFASRYEGEIASQSRVREYRQLGLRHHSSLMAEARGLRGRFSRELLEAHQVERSVQQVAGLVSHFAAMLQGQSGLAEGVHESAEHATDSVKQTERELLLTIQRSQNHSRNMTLLAVGLAFFLLLLDFITP